jgi:predicted nuclease with TOPRIM domain
MSNVVIPSSPADREKVNTGIKEISNALTRIEAERSFINDVLDRLDDEFDLPKKYMRRLAKVYHKQNITEVKAEAEELEDLYDSIIK